MSDIERLIKERQKEGEELFFPAKIIALRKGYEHPKKHGSIMRYTDAYMSISYDTYAPNLDVTANGRKVLIFHLGNITSFIPDEWVQHLLKTAKPLIAAYDREKEQDKQRREQERLRKWGIA